MRGGRGARGIRLAKVARGTKDSFREGLSEKRQKALSRNCLKFGHIRGGNGGILIPTATEPAPSRSPERTPTAFGRGRKPSKEVPVLDAKFFSGLALGMIAGMLLLDSSKDVKKLVEKGKDAVQEKISEMKKD